MDRNREVEDLTRQFYEALGKADDGAVAALISNDPAVTWIGTDPEEWWTGHETVADIFRAQLEATGGFDLTGDPIAYGLGEVAWVADQVTITLGADSLGARITAVAHRTGDAWRFVQWHASFGVGNADTFGEDLPT